MQFQPQTPCDAKSTTRIRMVDKRVLQYQLSRTTQVCLHCSVQPSSSSLQTTVRTSAARHPAPWVHRQQDATVDEHRQQTEDRRSTHDDQTALLASVSNTNSRPQAIPPTHMHSNFQELR